MCLHNCDQLIKTQEIFLVALSRYLNGRIIQKSDLIISLFLPSYTFKNNAIKIIDLYNSFEAPLPRIPVSSAEMGIELYRGNNKYVYQMMEYLKNHLKNDLFSAFVHGSLGTYEEITYSDFDALAIIKNEVFKNPARLADVARKISDSRKIMYDFDPLQHHGWFVLTERDLGCYPEYYFPSILLKYAKALFPEEGIELRIPSLNLNFDLRRSFDSTSANIIKRLEKKNYPRNIYQLKSLLSQFMLLPSLYLQAKYRKATYKKFSFDEAKKDFSEKDWEMMEEISSLRRSWNEKISGYRKSVMSKPSPLRNMCGRYLTPKISKDVSGKLTPRFYSEMKRLTISMRNNAL